MSMWTGKAPSKRRHGDVTIRQITRRRKAGRELGSDADAAICG
jgi:hypothetical protein